MSSVGPNLPSTGSSVYDAGQLWSNPGNITANDGSKASSALGSGQYSDLLQATGFDFSSIPSGATINGISVDVICQADVSLAIQDSRAKLLIAGVESGANKASGSNWVNDYTTTITYGSSSDLWSLTPSDSDVKASNFGFSWKVLNFDLMGSHTAYVDYIQITITYTATAGSSPATFTVTSRAPLRRVWSPARSVLVTPPVSPDAAPATSAAVLVNPTAAVPAVHRRQRTGPRSHLALPPSTEPTSGAIVQTSLQLPPPATSRRSPPRPRSQLVLPPQPSAPTFPPLFVGLPPRSRTQNWRPRSLLVSPITAGNGVCECVVGGAIVVGANLQAVLVNRPADEAFPVQGAYRASLVSANLKAVLVAIACDC